MSKALIGFLILVGFFFFLTGAIASKFILLIGLVMIGAGLYLGLGPEGILRKDQVLDTWAALIEKGNGKADEVLQDTECFVKDSKAPAIGMDRKDIAPGIIRGLAGTTRDFLVVTDQTNFRLRPYRIYVNARDYGENIDINWHLTYKPSMLQSIAALLPYVNVVPTALSDLDLFDQQDLRAYATNVHHCLLKSVEKLMIGLNQDVSKLERKSRGFLGIS
jgi:hypothetical protein